MTGDSQSGQGTETPPRSSRCSACGLRTDGDHTCPESPTYHGQWDWDAEHYDEMVVRINQGGGAITWYRKLKSSGRSRWHKLVPHPDGSPRDHWLTERDSVFMDWMQSTSAHVVPLGESPFADQQLYDELAERNGRTRAIINQHRHRMLEDAGSEGADADA